MSPRTLAAVRQLSARDRDRLVARLDQLRQLDRLMRQRGSLADVLPHTGLKRGQPSRGAL
ncbi:hypothetical protein ACWDOR_23820 [Streptosporangium canum]